MEVVAEGAETDSDAVELYQLGCEYAQGFAFGEPMTSDAARDLLVDKPSRLRALMTTLVSELADFVGEPKCSEMQADGAPCAAVDAACDECRKLTSILEGLRSRLQAS
jgi:hypothetical protein